jgi:D-serine/D-alanine/glycine transporter
MFYVFALIMIMSVTPWSSVVPTKSPFVELFVLVGLPAAASLINFVVLTSAASSANSGVFSPAVCCSVWRRRSGAERVRQAV